MSFKIFNKFCKTCGNYLQIFLKIQLHTRILFIQNVLHFHTKN